ncbi:unnamed protein product, partial [Phaeothamnion confervicola]
MESDVVMLSRPLLWCLRQQRLGGSENSGNGGGVEGAAPARPVVAALAALAPPLLEATARIAAACSYSEAAFGAMT